MGKEECLQHGQNHQGPAYRKGFWSWIGQKDPEEQSQGGEGKAMPPLWYSTAAVSRCKEEPILRCSLLA